MPDRTQFEHDLYLRAERLCTVERMYGFPPEHIERIYQELRLEIANGHTVEQAHQVAQEAIRKRMKKKDASND
ncbi:MAG: hypothetical protein VXW22_15570 [Pseudomonadota bacterium]|nr:hypothetical protein [Pseudomonadota bacterium]